MICNSAQAFREDIGHVTFPNFLQKAVHYHMHLVNWPVGICCPGMNGKGANDVKQFSAEHIHIALTPRLAYYHRVFANPDSEPENIELASFSFEGWSNGKFSNI